MCSSKMLQRLNVAVVKCQNRLNDRWTFHAARIAAWSFCGYMIHQVTGVHYGAVIFIFFTFLGMFTLSSLYVGDIIYLPYVPVSDRK
jgi:hypothetical protein